MLIVFLLRKPAWHHEMESSARRLLGQLKSLGAFLKFMSSATVTYCPLLRGQLRAEVYVFGVFWATLTNRASCVWYWGFYHMVFGSWRNIASPDKEISFKLYMYIYIQTYVYFRFLKVDHE